MSTEKYKIYFSQKRSLDYKLDPKLLKKAVRTALKAEGVNVPCEVSMYITDDVEIHETNLEFRGVDKSTDVLSFPMQEFIPGDFCPDDGEIDPETGRIPLGDIMISSEHAVKQGEEFGHSADREAAYLTVHSVLHLLGYDHLDEGEQKKQMRDREKVIMSLLELGE